MNVIGVTTGVNDWSRMLGYIGRFAVMTFASSKSYHFLVGIEIWLWLLAVGNFNIKQMYYTAIPEASLLNWKYITGYKFLCRYVVIGMYVLK